MNCGQGCILFSFWNWVIWLIIVANTLFFLGYILKQFGNILN